MTAPIASWPVAPENEVANSQASRFLGVGTGMFAYSSADDTIEESLLMKYDRWARKTTLNDREYSPTLTPEQATEKYGLGGKLKFEAPIREVAAKYLRDEKLNQLQRQEVLSRGSGFWQKSAGFGASFAASFADPLNIAAGFLPVVGEARYAQLLSRIERAYGAAAAESFLVRATARGVTGAIEGAAGNIPLEVAHVYAFNELQDEHDLNDSLLNILMGAGVGATLHVGVGAFADMLHPRTKMEVARGAIGQLADGEELTVPEKIAAMDEGNVHEQVIRTDPQARDVTERTLWYKDGEDTLTSELHTGEPLRVEARQPKVVTSQVFDQILKDPAILEELRRQGYDMLMTTDGKSASVLDDKTVVRPATSDERARVPTPDERAAITDRVNQETSRQLDTVQSDRQQAQKLSPTERQTEPIQPENLPEQDSPGKPANQRDQVAKVEKDTNQFITDNKDVLGERSFDKFDEEIKVAKAKGKGLLAAAGCILRNIL